MCDRLNLGQYTGLAASPLFTFYLLVGVRSLLLLLLVPGIDSVLGLSRQMPLPTELSHQPRLFILHEGLPSLALSSLGSTDKPWIILCVFCTLCVFCRQV